MSALAARYGIRPWEIDKLKMREFEALCKEIDDLANGD